MNRDHELLLDAWRINDRVTTFLVERIPDAVWGAALARSPRKTIRNIAAHLHNSRASWMKSLAVGAGVPIPPRVDPNEATVGVVSKALEASGVAIRRMLEAGLENDGEFPQVSSAFIWGAMPRNVSLFVAYAVSHEAHHRGQIVLMARELGHRLPAETVGGLWQWSSRLNESRSNRNSGA